MKDGPGAETDSVEDAAVVCQAVLQDKWERRKLEAWLSRLRCFGAAKKYRMC
jgi:hypothetical protein